MIKGVKPIHPIPSAICLYDGAEVENFDIRQIGDYLGQWFGASAVQIRKGFLQHHLGSGEEADQRIMDAVAEAFCGARIKDPARRLEKAELEPEQLREEGKWLREGQANKDVFYDGLALQQAYLELIDSEESSAAFVHIAFSDRLMGTWDQSDRRYHGRVGIYGLPSIISTTGVVEGPAKPREYYFGVMAGLDEQQVRKELAGRFVDYGDPRLTEILKGYAMQAVFYHLFGEPFCQQPDCRLFNAHWQEEMIRAQLQTGEDFCPEHRRLLQRLSGT